jgi:hypothetical protein
MVSLALSKRSWALKLPSYVAIPQENVTAVGIFSNFASSKSFLTLWIISSAWAGSSV